MGPGPLRAQASGHLPLCPPLSPALISSHLLGRLEGTRRHIIVLIIRNWHNDMYASSYKIHYNNLCQCISQYSTGYKKFLLQLLYHITVKQYGAIQLLELLHHITVKHYGAIRVDRMLCSYTQ